MIQDLQNIIDTQMYKTFDNQELIDFYKNIRAIGNFKRLYMTFDDMEWILTNVTTDDTFDNILINRFITMTKMESALDIHNILVFLITKKIKSSDVIFSAFIPYHQEFSDYYEAVVSFFAKTDMIDFNFYSMFDRIQRLYDIGEFEFQDIEQESRELLIKAFESDDFDTVKYTYHFDLCNLSNSDYTKYIFSKTLNQIESWTLGWPEDYYKEFLDYMPGSLEEFYKEKVSLPQDSDISQEDYEYYEYFLNKHNLVMNNLSKEQIQEYDDLPAGAIVKSGKLSIKEMKDMGKFSLAIGEPNKLLYESCLRDSEIAENTELFSNKLLYENNIWVSPETAQLLRDEQKYPIYRDIYTTAVQKDDFNLSYLRYLMYNVRVEFSILINILSQAPFKNKELLKKISVINRLYT